VALGHLFAVTYPNGTQYLLHLGGITDNNLPLKRIYATQNLKEGWKQIGTISTFPSEDPFFSIISYS